MPNLVPVYTRFVRLFRAFFVPIFAVVSQPLSRPVFLPGPKYFFFNIKNKRLTLQKKQLDLLRTCEGSRRFRCTVGAFFRMLACQQAPDKGSDPVVRITPTDLVEDTESLFFFLSALFIFLSIYLLLQKKNRF